MRYFGSSYPLKTAPPAARSIKKIQPERGGAEMQRPSSAACAWRVSGMAGLSGANGLPGSGSDGATLAFAPAMAGPHGAAGGARWRAGGHEDGALNGRGRHK